MMTRVASYTTLVGTTALYTQLRDAVVHAMRQETAEQLLRQPDLVDILVATCLAEVSQEDRVLARDQELARIL